MARRAPAWVAPYIGIPFKDKGRSRDGADCWGLVWLVSKEQFGIELPSNHDKYATAYDIAEIDRIIAGEMGPWVEVLAGQEVQGDVVLLRRGRAKCHVGVVLWPGKMLHVEEGLEACLEDYPGTQWTDRVIGCYRHADRYSA